MALFGKKDPCAICGGKVKGLFPHKIEGQLICGDCYGQVDLPPETESSMTMTAFRGYMNFRNENAQLKAKFQTTEKVDFGWLDTKFMFDMTNHLLCFDGNLDKTIFESKHIQSFIIREDATPLYEGSAQGLIHHASTVPERALAMQTQFAQMRMQERLMDMMDGDGQNDTPQRRMDIPEPFQNFVVDIYFQNHPYWRVFTADMSGPRFNNEHPNVNTYISEYQNRVATIDQLAHALMQFAFPNAGSGSAAGMGNPAPAAAPGADPVAELQRYKALMDQGILTPEEFAAKKRQLLGI